MSTRSFLSMAYDLLNEVELREKIAEKLLGEVNTVPHTTIHARTITFSISICTLLTQGTLSSIMSPDDTYRLVQAMTPLIKENFKVNKKTIKTIQQRRPHLIHTVRKAVAKVQRRTQSKVHHILAVVCFCSVGPWQWWTHVWKGQSEVQETIYTRLSCRPTQHCHCAPISDELVVLLDL